MINNLLTISEVAKALKLNSMTIYGYVRSGKLRAIRFGRSYRIDEKDLIKFIKQNKTK